MNTLLLWSFFLFFFLAIETSFFFPSVYPYMYFFFYCCSLPFSVENVRAIAFLRNSSGSNNNGERKKKGAKKEKEAFFFLFLSEPTGQLVETRSGSRYHRNRQKSTKRGSALNVHAYDGEFCPSLRCPERAEWRQKPFVFPFFFSYLL